jgi:hypothetical protein
MKIDIRPEHQCEAKINYRTINQGSTRFYDDFEGRTHDRGEGTLEEDAIEGVSIECAKCPQIGKFSDGKGIIFQVAGGPPFGAYNEAVRETTERIATGCEKWQALKRVFSVETPGSDFHPSLSGSSR